MAHESTTAEGGTPDEADQAKARKKALKAEKAQAKKAAKAKAKAENPERGIETMFRSASKNHIRLSQMADNKANILLSVNALIISVTVARLIPELALHQELRIPLGALVATCLSSMIFATISTIPKLTKGITTRDQCDRKEGNLLFFGNFHAMPQEKYEMAMRELMKDRDYLYGSLTRDLYHLGVVLHRKYALLRLSYMIFMWGLIVVVVLAAWAAYAAGLLG